VDNSGNGGNVGQPLQMDVVISGAEADLAQGWKQFAIMGARGGIALYRLQLDVFGGADPIEFLAHVLKEMRARTSVIVVPR